MGRKKILVGKETEIINLYNSGMSSENISKIYNVSRCTITNLLKDKHVLLRKRIYELNEHYFDVIDTQNKAYILGLLYADGCNVISNGCISISLQEQDKYILDWINKEIGSNRPLVFIDYHSKNSNYKNQYRLFISSKYMCDVLNNYGMYQAKSLILSFPEWLNESLYPHFIRGYFDGDGCLSYDEKRHKCTTRIVGTGEFCNFISKLLNNMKCKNNITHPKQSGNNNTFVVQTPGNKSSEQFLDWIYADTEFYMKRKHDKYLYFKEKYSKNKNNKT